MGMTIKRVLIVVVFSIMLVFSSFAEADKPQSPKNSAGTIYKQENVTWTQTDQGWTCSYNKDGQPFTGQWVSIYNKEGSKSNRKWYFFNESGVMQTGWLFFDNDWFYLQSDGSAVIGNSLIQEIDGFYYMFSMHGTIYRNESIIRGGSLYTFDEQGRIIYSGDNKYTKTQSRIKSESQLDYINFTRKEKDITLLIHDNDLNTVAKQAFDFTTANQGSITLSKVYSLALNQTQNNIIHIAYIYCNASAESYSMYLSSEAEDALLNLWFTRVGYYKQGGKIMIIMAAYEGESATQLSPELAQGKWLLDEGEWKYQRNDGTYAISCWVKNPADGEWYHFDENGHMNKGWFQDTEGKWYYFDLASGVMQVNKTVDGYLLDADGVRQ